MRNVAVAKPHLFKGMRAWWCVQNGMRIGAGGTPLDAYDNWLLRNLAAA